MFEAENFILFLLASAGMTHIIVDGSILTPTKQWLEDNKWTRLLQLVNCYQCAGAWCGLIVAVILSLSLFPGLFWLQYPLYGFAASLIANLLAALMGFLNIGAGD